MVLSLAWGSFFMCTFRLVFSHGLKRTPSRYLELSAWTHASSLILCCQILAMLALLNLVSSNQQNHWVLSGFLHNALQPRNPFQAASQGNHRIASLEGMTTFVLIYWLYKLRMFGKILKRSAFWQAQVLLSILAMRPVIISLWFVQQLYLDLSLMKGKEILENSLGDNKMISNNQNISWLGRKILIRSFSFLINVNPNPYSNCVCCNDEKKLLRPKQTKWKTPPLHGIYRDCPQFLSHQT